MRPDASEEAHVLKTASSSMIVKGTLLLAEQLSAKHAKPIQ